MKIFISWSGDLSQRVAELLRDFVKDMLHEVEPFMSKHDLESGTRWGPALAQQLEDTSFGLICLTPDNLTSPWLLFEAGALTKHADGRACGLLLNGLGPAGVSGPLALFQHRTFDRDSVGMVMRDVNAKIREPLQPDRLARAFAKWWPDLERDVVVATEAAAKSSRMPSPPQRQSSEILEEVLVRVREIQAKLGQPPADVESATALAKQAREAILAKLYFINDERTQDLFRLLLRASEPIFTPNVETDPLISLLALDLVEVSDDSIVSIPFFVKKAVALSKNGWWSPQK